MDINKIIENYKKICEFLLGQAVNTPIGTNMIFNITENVGHYAVIEIAHKHGKAAYLRVYDCPSIHGHPPQNYFFAGDDIKKISATIAKDRPTIELMKNLVIGWHRYGIKENLLLFLDTAKRKAIEKIEAEKEIDNFVV